MKPVLLVIGGPNGSGKTTITVRLRRALERGCRVSQPGRRGSDPVRRMELQRGGLEGSARRHRASRAAAQRAKGIAFETVLSTYEKVEFISRARTAGYFVRVFFVGTSDPQINVDRVAARVAGGGHDVPRDKIVKRYDGALANLPVLIDIADRVYIYDNSIDGAEAQLCGRTMSGSIRKVYGHLPEWVAAALDGMPRHADFEHAR